MGKSENPWTSSLLWNTSAYSALTLVAEPSNCRDCVLPPKVPTCSQPGIGGLVTRFTVETADC